MAGGSAIPKEIENPAQDWLSDRAWSEILRLPVLVSHIQNEISYVTLIWAHRGHFHLLVEPRNIYSAVKKKKNKERKGMTQEETDFCKMAKINSDCSLRA